MPRQQFVVEINSPAMIDSFNRYITKVAREQLLRSYGSLDARDVSPYGPSYRREPGCFDPNCPLCPPYGYSYELEVTEAGTTARLAATKRENGFLKMDLTAAKTKQAKAEQEVAALKDQEAQRVAAEAQAAREQAAHTAAVELIMQHAPGDITLADVRERAADIAELLLAD